MQSTCSSPAARIQPSWTSTGEAVSSRIASRLADGGRRTPPGARGARRDVTIAHLEIVAAAARRRRDHDHGRRSLRASGTCGWRTRCGARQCRTGRRPARERLAQVGGPARTPTWASPLDEFLEPGACSSIEAATVSSRRPAARRSASDVVRSADALGCWRSRAVVRNRLGTPRARRGAGGSDSLGQRGFDACAAVADCDCARPGRTRHPGSDQLVRPGATAPARAAGPCPPRCGAARRAARTAPAPCTGARCSRHSAARASASTVAPSRGTTNAHGTSPRRSSGMPATAHSATSGDRRITSATSSGKTLRPPRLIMSDTRPSIQRKPSSSMRPRSPVWNQPSTRRPSMSSPARGALVDHRRAHQDLAQVVADAQLHVLVGAADRAEVGVAELLGVLRAPADDLAADLGLAPAVEHDDPEAVAEPARLQRRQRRGDAAHVLQRRERRDRLVVGEHRHRRRRAAPSTAAGSARRTRRTPACRSGP